MRIFSAIATILIVANISAVAQNISKQEKAIEEAIDLGKDKKVNALFRYGSIPDSKNVEEETFNNYCKGKYLARNVETIEKYIYGVKKKIVVAFEFMVMTREVSHCHPVSGDDKDIVFFDEFFNNRNNWTLDAPKYKCDIVNGKLLIDLKGNNDAGPEMYFKNRPTANFEITFCAKYSANTNSFMINMMGDNKVGGRAANIYFGINADKIYVYANSQNEDRKDEKFKNNYDIMSKINPFEPNEFKVQKVGRKFRFFINDMLSHESEFNFSNLVGIAFNNCTSPGRQVEVEYVKIKSLPSDVYTLDDVILATKKSGTAPVSMCKEGLDYYKTALLGLWETPNRDQQLLFYQDQNANRLRLIKNQVEDGRYLLKFDVPLNVTKIDNDIFLFELDYDSTLYRPIQYEISNNSLTISSISYDLSTFTYSEGLAAHIKSGILSNPNGFLGKPFTLNKKSKEQHKSERISSEINDAYAFILVMLLGMANGSGDGGSSSSYNLIFEGGPAQPYGYDREGYPVYDKFTPLYYDQYGNKKW